MHICHFQVNQFGGHERDSHSFLRGRDHGYRVTDIVPAMNYAEGLTDRAKSRFVSRHDCLHLSNRICSFYEHDCSFRAYALDQAEHPI